MHRVAGFLWQPQSNSRQQCAVCAAPALKHPAANNFKAVFPAPCAASMKTAPQSVVSLNPTMPMASLQINARGQEWRMVCYRCKVYV